MRCFYQGICHYTDLLYLVLVVTLYRMFCCVSRYSKHCVSYQDPLYYLEVLSAGTLQPPHCSLHSRSQFQSTAIRQPLLLHSSTSPYSRSYPYTPPCLGHLVRVEMLHPDSRNRLVRCFPANTDAGVLGSSPSLGSTCIFGSRFEGLAGCVFLEVGYVLGE